MKRLPKNSVWLRSLAALLAAIHVSSCATATERYSGGFRQLNRNLLLIALLLVSGCASTPEEVRERCLAHDVPQPPNAERIAGAVAGAVLTLGISGAVDQSRTMADCSEILGDESLKESCPAYVAWCEQYFAERRNAAGASKVVINNQLSPPAEFARSPTFTDCTGFGHTVNCISH
jgi:hypothetical protein